MADTASTPTATVVKTDDGYVVATWTSTLNGVATAAKVSMGQIAEGSLSVQLTGSSFGSGTFLIEGSNDGTNFVTCYLQRQQTTAGKQDAASFTAAGAAKLMDDAYRYYRYTSSGGTSSAVPVTLVARRA